MTIDNGRKMKIIERVLLLHLKFANIAEGVPKKSNFHNSDLDERVSVIFWLFLSKTKQD